MLQNGERFDPEHISEQLQYNSGLCCKILFNLSAAAQAKDGND